MNSTIEMVIIGYQHVEYTKKDGTKNEGYRVYGRNLNDMRTVNHVGDVVQDGYMCAEWWSREPVEIGAFCRLRRGKHGWYEV